MERGTGREVMCSRADGGGTCSTCDTDAVCPPDKSAGVQVFPLATQVGVVFEGAAVAGQGVRVRLQRENASHVPQNLDGRWSYFFVGGGRRHSYIHAQIMQLEDHRTASNDQTCGLLDADRCMQTGRGAEPRNTRLPSSYS